MDESKNMLGSYTETCCSRNTMESNEKQDNVVPGEKIEGYVGNKHLAYLLDYIREQGTNSGSKVVHFNDLKHEEPWHGDFNMTRRNHLYSEDGKRESAKLGRKGADEEGQNNLKREFTIQPIKGEDKTSEQKTSFSTPVETEKPTFDLDKESQSASMIPTGCDVAEEETIPSAKPETSRARNRKKSAKTHVTYSQEVEGYVGNKNLTFLLNYIGELDTKVGSKKKSSVVQRSSQSALNRRKRH